MSEGNARVSEGNDAAAKQTTQQQILIRMDSGNDAVENYAVMYWDDEKIKFLVKHIFRRENRDMIAEELRKCCKNISNPLLIAGHLTAHARKATLSLGRSSPWSITFIRIFSALS